MKPYFLKTADFKGGSSYQGKETSYHNKKDFEDSFNKTGQIFRFNKGEYIFVLTTMEILCYKRGKFKGE